jgi:hypothetical protein
LSCIVCSIQSVQAEDQAQADLLRGLAGMPADPENDKLDVPDPKPKSVSFDGGARRDQPPLSEPHGVWLARVLRN